MPTIDPTARLSDDCELAGDVRIGPGCILTGRVRLGPGVQLDAYNILEGLQVNGGINNIADRDPFVASLTRPAGFRGRFFYLGVKGQF